MEKLKNIFYMVFLISIFLIIRSCEQKRHELEIESKKIENKKLLIKGDSLKKINDSLYTKYVADTMTIKQLRAENKKLGLQIENPKVVTIIKFKPKEVEKEISQIQTQDSIIKIIDYYPNKKNPFIKYVAKINKNTNKGTGNFKFSPQKIILGIGENKNGTYSVNTKLPEYLEGITIDVQSQPIKQQKKDNFGWIVGAGYGKEITTNSEFYKVNTGVRYKKKYFNVSVGIGKLQTIEGGINFEF